jgi:hypothetical protein
MIDWIFDFMTNFRPVLIGALAAYMIAAVAIMIVGTVRTIKRVRGSK